MALVCAVIGPGAPDSVDEAVAAGGQAGTPRGGIQGDVVGVGRREGVEPVEDPVPVVEEVVELTQPAEVHHAELRQLPEGPVEPVAVRVGEDEVALGVSGSVEDVVEVPAQDLPTVRLGVPGDEEVLGSGVPVPHHHRHRGVVRSCGRSTFSRIQSRLSAESGSESF